MHVGNYSYFCFKYLATVTSTVVYENLQFVIVNHLTTRL